jgi:hypothetical protein
MVCQGHQRRKSRHLFSRTIPDLKSPSVIPVEIESNESPEIPVENDLPEDAVENSIEPSPESPEPEAADTTLEVAEISGEEAEWDPLAAEEIEVEEVLEDLTTDSGSLNSEQPAANSQEEEITEETTEITTETASEAEPDIEFISEETEAIDPVAESEPEEDAIDPRAESEPEEDAIDPVDESKLEEDAIVAEADETDADIESTEVTDEDPEDEEDEDAEDTLVDIPLLLSDVVGGLGTVTDPSGQLSVIWKFDGGAYEGQVGVVSTAGLENYDLNSIEFMQEAIRRALDNIVVDDTTKGAEFGGWMNGEDSNHGEFAGVQTVQLSVGEQFFLALIPNGTFADILYILEKGEIPTGNARPLFSLATANPKDMEHFVQLVDLTGKGSLFALEDIRGDEKSDWDLNDIIITLKGAEVDAAQLDDLIETGVITEAPKWMETNLGITIVESAIDDLWIEPEDLVSETYDFPKEDQPLIGFIDTHLTTGNPDINYSNIIFGKDWIENDSNPTVVAGEGTHADHILGIVAATQDNGLGIDGINDDAPLWVSSAVESGKWADALVEFVDAAIASNQPNAIINLSIDLTQVNPDGSVTTRYEFTPQERGAIEYARQSGVLIVAAAGNDGGVMSVLGQASQEFDNIITVGAADGLARAAYSSYGYGLDIVAPGGTVENPVLSTTGEGVGSMAGTSVATAKVTGAASQVWAANPELSYRQVIEILKETATDLNTPGWDAETGAGLLNMAAAISLAKISVGEDYKPVPWFAPDSWSGEGKVIASERAVATEFRGKYYDWESYKIKTGDTLSAIALKTMGQGSADYYNFIAQRNGISNPNFLSPGQIIQIPKAVVVSANAPKPGENKVPFSAGTLTNTVKSQSGVSTYYYQNGFLTVQPSGASAWTTTAPSSTVVNKSGLAAPALLSSTSSTQTGKVNSPIGYVNVRPSASTSGSPIKTINNGVSVPVIRKLNGAAYDNGRTDWYEVIVDGRVAYIASAYLSVSNTTVTPTETRKVNSPIGYVNVRPSASTSGSPIKTINNGVSVPVIRKLNGAAYDNGRTDWYEVIVDGRLAYIAGAYLSAINTIPNPTQTLKVNSPIGYVNVRPSASTSGSPIKTINNGVSVPVIRKLNGAAYDNGRTDWYEVIVDGRLAYIAGAYLSAINTIPDPIQTGQLRSFSNFSASEKQQLEAGFYFPPSYGNRYARVSTKSSPKQWAGESGQRARYLQDGDMPIVANPQNRTADQIRQVIQYFNVSDVNNKRYTPNGWETYCNIFARDVMFALRAPLPHWQDTRELDANTMFDWLKQGNGWRSITASEAAQSASKGLPALAAWKNPSGIGHIAVVRPPDAGSPNTPRIAQAGATNFSNGSVSDGFGNRNVSYFVYG